MSDVTNESSTAWLTDLRMLRSRRRAAKQLETVFEMWVFIDTSLSMKIPRFRTYFTGCTISQKNKSNLVSIIVSEHQNLSRTGILLVWNPSNTYRQSSIIIIQDFSGYCLVLLYSLHSSTYFIHRDITVPASYSYSSMLIYLG